MMYDVPYSCLLVAPGTGATSGNSMEKFHFVLFKESQVFPFRCI